MNAEWQEQFLLQLRIREVSGSRIGDLLAEVQAHCADTGESPEQAFGDPATYAAAVSGNRRTTPLWRVGLQAAVGVIAAGGVLLAVGGLAAGSPAVISAGGVAVVLLAGVGVPLVFRGLGDTGPSRWWTQVLLLLMLGTAVAPVLWRTPVVSVPAAPLLVVCAGLLVAVFARGHRDPVIDPRTGRDPLLGPWQARLLPWLPVVPLTIAVTLTWFLTRNP